MKKFKKLIPALCMLLISAVLMGTSTYAWFSMNKTVGVTGMAVKARAEGGIVIGRTGTARADAKTTVTLTFDAQALLSTSTANGNVWYHAESKVDTEAAALEGTLTTLTFSDSAPATAALGLKYVANAADANDKSLAYVLYDTVTVFPDKNSSSFTDLWVASCTASTVTKDLSKSLRVAFVCGDKVVICAPAYDSIVNYTVGTNADGKTAAGTAVKALGTSATGTTPLAKVTSAGSTDNTNILVADGTKTGTNGVSVNVYVYFEGEDANHTTYNLGIENAIEDLKISYTFKCTSVAAA